MTQHGVHRAMGNLLETLFIRHEIGKDCKEFKRFNIDRALSTVLTGNWIIYTFASEVAHTLSTGSCQDHVVVNLLSHPPIRVLHLVHDDVSLTQAFPDFLANLKDSEAINDLGPDVTTFQMDGFKLKCAGPIGIHAHYQGKHGLIAFLDKFNIER